MVPVVVTGGLTFSGLRAGTSHTCGLALGDTAYSWGSNPYGQLGNGTTAVRTVPVAVSGGRSFTSLAAADTHTCGLVSGSTAYYCRGYKNRG